MSVVYRGLGGTEFEFDLPLSPHILAQVKSGDLILVEQNGEDKRPEANSPREEWVRYLVIVHRVPAVELKGVAKPELIAMANERES